jgi:N4-gp56 family major capsid protein
MAFTTNLSGVTQLDNSLITEFDQQFIIAAADQGLMDQFVSYKKMIGAKSIDFPKYAQLALATTPLVEADDPVSEAMSDSQIILTPVEYGNVVTRTKLASLQTGGKADLAAARLVGLNMGRTLDKLAILAGEASTNEIFANGAANEAALVAADTIQAEDVLKAYTQLRAAGVQPLSDGMYVLVLHPHVAHDLKADVGSGSWTDINKYGRPETVLRGEIGMFGGFKVVEDANITINTDAGAAAVDSYHSLCLGFNALGKAVSADPAGVMTGPFDKLNRFVNIGWYGCLQYKIVDTDAIRVITAASSLGTNV